MPEMTTLPSLDSLRCFCEAARLLNFRVAARTVALTPAALGQRIKQLEDLLGKTLFVRNTRHVSLTPEGLAFLPLAQKAVAAAESCVLFESSQPAPIDLVLGTRHELGMSWIVPMLPSLKKAFPHVTFHLYFGSGMDLLNRVRMQEIHCAVGSMRTMDPRIDAAPLHPEQYVFAASPRLLKTKRLKTYEDAQAHTLIDSSAELPLFQYWKEAASGTELPRFRDILYMGTIAAVRQQVLQGVGVAVLPQYLIAKDLETKRLVRVFTSVTPQADYFRLYFRSDDLRRPLYEHVAQLMRSHPLA